MRGQRAPGLVRRQKLRDDTQVRGRTAGPSLRLQAHLKAGLTLGTLRQAIEMKGETQAKVIRLKRPALSYATIPARARENDLLLPPPFRALRRASAVCSVLSTIQQNRTIGKSTHDNIRARTWAKARKRREAKVRGDTAKNYLLSAHSPTSHPCCTSDAGVTEWHNFGTAHHSSCRRAYSSGRASEAPTLTCPAFGVWLQ